MAIRAPRLAAVLALQLLPIQPVGVDARASRIDPVVGKEVSGPLPHGGWDRSPIGNISDTL